MCQSLAVGFEARCFILCKMGDGYNTYQRAELRVSHWLVGVPSPYLRQKAFEGQWGRVSDIPGGGDGLRWALWGSGLWGVLKGFGVHIFQGDNVEGFDLECRAKGKGVPSSPNSPTWWGVGQ